MWVAKVRCIHGLCTKLAFEWVAIILLTPKSYPSPSWREMYGPFLYFMICALKLILKWHVNTATCCCTCFLAFSFLICADWNECRRVVQFVHHNSFDSKQKLIEACRMWYLFWFIAHFHIVLLIRGTWDRLFSCWGEIYSLSLPFLPCHSSKVSLWIHFLFTLQEIWLVFVPGYFSFAFWIPWWHRCLQDLLWLDCPRLEVHMGKR